MVGSVAFYRQHGASTATDRSLLHQPLDLPGAREDMQAVADESLWTICPSCTERVEFGPVTLPQMATRLGEHPRVHPQAYLDATLTVRRRQRHQHEPPAAEVAGDRDDLRDRCFSRGVVSGRPCDVLNLHPDAQIELVIERLALQYSSYFDARSWRKTPLTANSRIWEFLNKAFNINSDDEEETRQASEAVQAMLAGAAAFVGRSDQGAGRVWHEHSSYNISG